MPLTGSQIGRIQKAILAAFDRNELRRVLRICMDASLDGITSDRLPFRTQVFELVEWADRAGRVLALLECAHEDVPDNAMLAAAWAEAQRWAELERAPAAPQQPMPQPSAQKPPAQEPPAQDPPAQEPSAQEPPAPAAPKHDAAGIEENTRLTVQPPTPAAPSGDVHILVARMQAANLPAAKRLQAGLRAADLGDLPPDQDTFILVPGLSVRIGKYPVTNFQFRRFVDAGGYALENELRWWSAEGIAYKHKFGWTEPRYWNDPKWNRATQPVAGVSWYEAEAYCNWLDETRTGLRDDEYARLPTVAEWEAAARGGQPKPAGAQDYPWRSAFKPELANTKESNLQQTTPVHMYPAGATPQGVCDLAGNVWQWTTEPNEGYAGAYWLVGGSWYNDAMPISAARYRLSGRDLRAVSGGFRVVAVPGLS